MYQNLKSPSSIYSFVDFVHDRVLRSKIRNNSLFIPFIIIIKKFLFKEIAGVLACRSVGIKDFTDVAEVVTVSVLIVCVHRRHC